MHGGDEAIGVPETAAGSFDLVEAAQQLLDMSGETLGHAKLDHRAEQRAFTEFSFFVACYLNEPIDCVLAAHASQVPEAARGGPGIDDLAGIRLAHATETPLLEIGDLFPASLLRIGGAPIGVARSDQDVYPANIFFARVFNEGQEIASDVLRLVGRDQDRTAVFRQLVKKVLGQDLALELILPPKHQPARVVLQKSSNSLTKCRGLALAASTFKEQDAGWTRLGGCTIE